MVESLFPFGKSHNRCEIVQAVPLTPVRGRAKAQSVTSLRNGKVVTVIHARLWPGRDERDPRATSAQRIVIAFRARCDWHTGNWACASVGETSSRRLERTLHAETRVDPDFEWAVCRPSALNTAKRLERRCCGGDATNARRKNARPLQGPRGWARQDTKNKRPASRARRQPKRRQILRGPDGDEMLMMQGRVPGAARSLAA
jgi:hypothetical protein